MKPNTMVRGANKLARGGANRTAPAAPPAPAATPSQQSGLGFEDSAITEAHIANRGSDNYDPYFNAVEGEDVLSNTFQKYHEAVPLNIECDASAVFPAITSDEANKMISQAFKKAKN